MQTTLTYTIVE